jgi:hypothetical protein
MYVRKWRLMFRVEENVTYGKEEPERQCRDRMAEGNLEF